jgi:hypothetical protein
MLTTKKSREEMFISTSTSQTGRVISLPITKNIIDMKNLGIMDICMIKHGLTALIANEKVTLKTAIKKGDREQIARSNSYIDEVNAVIRKLNS